MILRRFLVFCLMLAASFFVNGGAHAAYSCTISYSNCKANYFFNANMCYACPTASTKTGQNTTNYCTCNPGYTTTGNFGGPTTTSSTSTPCLITRGTTTFNSNDGTSSFNDKQYTYNTANTILANPWTNAATSSKKFIGWGLDAGDTTPAYTNNQAVTFTASAPPANLYAIWEDCPCSPTNATCAANALSPPALACSYTTACFTGYHGGTPNTYDHSCVINTFNIHYDPNGGSTPPADDQCTYDQQCDLTFTEPAVTPAGYPTFAGWADTVLNATGGTEILSYNNATATHDDTVDVFAIWRAGCSAGTAVQSANAACSSISAQTGYWVAAHNVFYGATTPTGSTAGDTTSGQINLCPAGYQAGVGTTDITKCKAAACPSGKYWSGSTNSCEDCAAGNTCPGMLEGVEYGSKDADDGLAPCTGSTWAPDNSSTCGSCPAETSGWTAGTGSGWAQRSDCYQTIAAASPCVGGTLKQFGDNSADAWDTTTTHIDLALHADAGYFVDNNAMTCLACPNGSSSSYSNTGTECACNTNMTAGGDWTDPFTTNSTICTQPEATITYDKNGAGGAPQAADVTCKYGEECFFVGGMGMNKPGAAFMKWDDNASCFNGGKEKNTYTASNLPPTTLYACWGVCTACANPLICTLDTSNGCQYNIDCSNLGNPAGYTIQQNNGYDAICKANKYTVKLDANGGTIGTKTSITNVAYNEVLPQIASPITALPKRAQYAFTGFWSHPVGGTQYLDQYGLPTIEKWPLVTTGSMIYAQWAECGVGYYCDGSAYNARVACPSLTDLTWGYGPNTLMTARDQCYQSKNADSPCVAGVLEQYGDALSNGWDSSTKLILAALIAGKNSYVDNASMSCYACPANGLTLAAGVTPWSECYKVLDLLGINGVGTKECKYDGSGSSDSDYNIACQYDITACDGGYYDADGAARVKQTCTTVGVGSWSAPGSIVKNACPTGYGIGPATDAEDNCKPRACNHSTISVTEPHYWDGAAESCQSCPGGWYCNGLDSNFSGLTYGARSSDFGKTICSAGHFCPAKSSGETICSSAGMRARCPSDGMAEPDCGAGWKFNLMTGLCEIIPGPCAVKDGFGMYHTDGTCLVSGCVAGYHASPDDLRCEPDEAKCSTAYGNGVAEWDNTLNAGLGGYKPCRETLCEIGYGIAALGGGCQPCSQSNVLSYKRVDNGECIVDLCVTGYHVEGGNLCRENTRNCDVQISNGYGIDTWRNGVWSGCIASDCDSDYHIENNVCVSNIKACPIKDDADVIGDGRQEWIGSATSGKWGACEAETCKPGWTNDRSMTNEWSKACGRCNNYYGYDGQQAAYAYKVGEQCVVSQCLYQGEKYNLQNGECIPICEPREDETGKIVGFSNGKCQITCEAGSGYAKW